VDEKNGLGEMETASLLRVLAVGQDAAQPFPGRRGEWQCKTTQVVRNAAGSTLFSRTMTVTPNLSAVHASGVDVSRLPGLNPGQFDTPNWQTRGVMKAYTRHSNRGTNFLLSGAGHRAPPNSLPQWSTG